MCHPTAAAEIERQRRLKYLSDCADLEVGLIALALVDVNAGDARARRRALAAAIRAFEEALANAPSTPRLAFEATLGKAAALRENGEFREALDLLHALRAKPVPPVDRPRFAYELVVTLVRAEIGRAS